MAKNDTTPLLPRVARPFVVWLFVFVVIATGAVAFYLGTSTAKPETEALTRPKQAIVVTAEVTSRVVIDNSLGTGTVIAGSSKKIAATGSGSPLIMTGAAVAAGAQIHAPAYLASVNDHPLFVINVTIPQFRDLVLDDKGSDVRSLRQAFGLEAEGSIDGNVQKAVDALYQSAGYAPPRNAEKKLVIARTDFVPLPRADATVAGVAPIGAELNADTPVATLQLEPNAIQARLPANKTRTLAVGTQVLLTLGGTTQQGTVAFIGEFTTGNNGAPAGRDVVFRFTDAAAAQTATVGSPVTLSTKDTAQPMLAVPMTAVRQELGKAYVSVPSATSEPSRLIEVTVRGEAGGFVAVESPDLREGDRVIVE